MNEIQWHPPHTSAVYIRLVHQNRVTPHVLYNTSPLASPKCNLIFVNTLRDAPGGCIPNSQTGWIWPLTQHKKDDAAIFTPRPDYFLLPSDDSRTKQLCAQKERNKERSHISHLSQHSKIKAMSIQFSWSNVIYKCKTSIVSKYLSCTI